MATDKTITLAVALESEKLDKGIEKKTKEIKNFKDTTDALVKYLNQRADNTCNNIGKIATATVEVQERVKALNSLNLKSFDTVEKLNTARMQAIENEIAADAKKGESIEKTNELYKQKEQMLIEQSETAKKRTEKEYALLIEAAKKAGSDTKAIEIAQKENITAIDKKHKEDLKKNEEAHFTAVKAIVDKGLKETTDLLTKNIYHGTEKLDKDSEKKKKRLEEDTEKQKGIIDKWYDEQIINAEGNMKGIAEIEEEKAARIEVITTIHDAKMAKIKEEAAEKAKKTTETTAKDTTQKAEEVAKKTEESAKKAEGAWTQVFNVGEMSKNIQEGLKNIKHYNEQLDLSMQNEIMRYKELEKTYTGDAEALKAVQEAKKEIIAKYAAEKIRIEEMITAAEEKENGLRMERWKQYVENAGTAMGKVNKHASEVQKYTDTLNESTKNLNNQLSELSKKEVEELSNNITEKESLITKHNETLSGLEAQKTDKINELRQQGLSDEQIASDEKLISLNEQINNETALRNKEVEEKEKYEKEKAKKEKHRKQQQKIADKINLINEIVKATANIAAGATKALSYGPILGPVLATLVTGMGAIQIAVMTKQLAKFEDGGLLNGKRHSQGGMRIEGSNIEVEGGEYVVNRESTKKNLGLVRYINSNRKELTSSDINSYFTKSERGYEAPFSRMFQAGGELPAIEVDNDNTNQLLVDAIKSIRIEPKVAVTDIHRVQDDMVNVSGWSGM